MGRYEETKWEMNETGVDDCGDRTDETGCGKLISYFLKLRVFFFWWGRYWASGRKPEPTVEQRIREAFMTLSARELSEYAGTLEDKHQGFC